MSLPTLNIQLTNSIKGLPDKGRLLYTYNSFYNLQNSNATEEESLIGLNITSEEAGIEVDKPIQIDTEVRYDDSEKRVITEPVEITQEFRYFDFSSPWEQFEKTQ